LEEGKTWYEGIDLSKLEPEEQGLSARQFIVH